MLERFSPLSPWLLVVILGSFQLVTAQGSALYPFGLDAGDASLPRDRDDISSPEIMLQVPVVFYGQKYPSLYVNQNGLISFRIEVPTFVSIQFPLDYPSIAPFYSDVDPRISGSVFYRETTSEDLLEKARLFLQETFSSGESFRPISLFVVTWDSVGYFNRKSDKVNTFQVVIANDGTESYTVFIYGNIEWVQGTGKNPSMPDAKAQAGFISGNGPHYSLKGSGSDQVSSLHKRSNVGQQGIWAFRIGQIGDAPQEPDRVSEIVLPEFSSSCSSGGAAICHSRAVCVDYSPGFCCECGTGFYGNGKTCFENDIPERAIGKVKGMLNGIPIEDADLYSYVVPADGRAYTAIAKIVDRLGYDFQSLSVIGAVFGWLFSVSLNGTPNGFQLTGGVFNYTAEVSFLQTGHKVTITQAYTGLDVFSQLKVETRIHGTTTVVPVGMKIELNDFEILLTRISPGTIRSKSNHNYRLEGTSTDNPFSIEQTIAYEECQYKSPLPPDLQTIKMKVGKSYIEYDGGLEIVRYAMSSAISPPDGGDPCKTNETKCPPLSSCVADGNSFSCICNLGYEEEYVEGDDDHVAQCVDIDECGRGTSDCDVTAHCINREGSYECRCRDTYVGDGRTCSKMLTCSDVQCGENAECIEKRMGEPECQCLSGYRGDGLFCVEKNPDDEENENAAESVCRTCDRNAECISEMSGTYYCKCRDEYYGNGTSCKELRESRPEPEPSDCLDIEICHPYADCLPMSNREGAHHCVCRYPFVGDGFSCKDSRMPETVMTNPIPECPFGIRCYCPPEFQYDDARHQCLPTELINERSCDVDGSICDLNADCIPQHGEHQCVCKSGFSGNGRECLPRDLCTSHADCGGYSECRYNRTELRYRCDCKEGFVFVENQCLPGANVGCDVVNNCNANGRCIWESSLSKFQCECKPGFLGDGFQCQEDMTGCNVLNNCARNAECFYDTKSRLFKCQCRQGFEGDGKFCRSAIPCYQDSSVCDVNAECRPNPGNREWGCQCKPGYIGDGFDCQEAVREDNQFLLIAKGMSVIKVMLTGEKAQPILVEPFQTAVGIGIDCPNRKVYWSDVAGRMVKASRFNGSEKMTFLSEDVGSPEGLTVDWASQNLYWTDSSKDTIEVANLLTKKRKTLISNDLVNPRGIAVYPQRGRIFWTDWNRAYPKIEYAGMDGFGRQLLLGEGLALPNSLTIDHRADQLCFADAGTHKIECIGIDGRGRRTFVHGVKYAFGLAMDSETFYWSDWNTSSIERASRRTGVLGESVEVALGGPGKLYGIVLVPEMCQQVYSPCSRYTCPEEELICLPNIRGGRSCRCSDTASVNCKDIL